MTNTAILPVPNPTITAAKGFTCGAVYAGLKTYGKDKLDFAVLLSEQPATAAGVFTQNTVASPTVPLSRQRVAKGKAQAIVMNSGCANACVGPQGMTDAKETTQLVAEKLGLSADRVLVASTGIIGVELPMPLIRKAIKNVELSPKNGAAFARAMMTTDSHPKEVAVKFSVGGKECTIGAACKGVGMLHPNMATMLAFVATDAAVEQNFLQSALKGAVDLSLNMVSVDGDTSTNDMCLVLANGMAGNKEIKAETPAGDLFLEALTEVLTALAKMIARDGEGATKLIEVNVEGAVSAEDARKAARTIASSPLWKAAVHGNDPNWGRVMAALGRSNTRVQEEKLSMFINEFCVFDAGMPISFYKEAASNSMKEAEEAVKVVVKLGLGNHKATAWGCDLTEEYVRFNSAYHT